MLPIVLQKIVDEYVGIGFTQCKIGEIKGFPVGCVGDNKIMMFGTCKYEILDYESGQVELCDTSPDDNIYIAADGLWTSYDRRTIYVHNKNKMWKSNWEDDIHSVRVRKNWLWVEFFERFLIYDYKHDKVLDVQYCQDTCKKKTWVHKYQGQCVLHRDSSPDVGMVHDYEFDSFNGMKIWINGEAKEYDGNNVCEYGPHAFVYDSQKWQVVELQQGEIIQRGTFHFIVSGVFPMTNNRLLIDTFSDATIMC